MYNIKKRTSSYITTIPNNENAKIVIDALKKEFPCDYIWPRGRHSNRKAILGNKWKKGRQNDISWKIAETISIYKKSK